MHKRIIGVTQEAAIASEEWLDLGTRATVEVSSEADGYPIENALQPGTGAGWRAAQPGTQTVRLIFDEPQDLSRVHLEFMETETARTQEFVLRWSGDTEKGFHDIVRQQWNFSRQSTREEENYALDIRGATVLELTIIPDNSCGGAPASLQVLRVA